MRLHDWMFDDPSVFEEVYGDLAGGTGAVIMGRRTFDNSIEEWGGKGPLGEVPCFVLTHRPVEGADPPLHVRYRGCRERPREGEGAPPARSGSA
jgi:dihydrofolate reductase